MYFLGKFIALITICLTSRKVNSLGDLKMIYHPSVADTISVTCSSTDDRAALIWNHDLKRSSSEPKAFPRIWPKTTPNECAIVDRKGCITKWDKSDDWTIVDSYEHPMEPVYDSRWEDFEEHSLSMTNWNNKYVNNSTKTIVFSIRGTKNVPMRCIEGNMFSSENFIFAQIGNYTEENISENEWRTVVQTINEYRVLTEVYDTKRLIQIQTPTGLLDEACKENKFNESIRGFSLLFYRQESFRIDLFKDLHTQGRVRYHFYKYFLTTKKDAKLSTMKFNHTEQSFCIQLLVSLCSKCNLIFRVADNKDSNKIIGNISGNEYEFWRYRLPTWQVVQVSGNLSTKYENPIKLEIFSSLTDSDNEKGRWAIDSFRKCTSVDQIRSVSSVEKFTSNIQCQKLSYTGDDAVIESADLNIHGILDKLEPPRIRNITATTAQLSYPAQLDEIMRSITYRYEIKTEKIDWKPITESHNSGYNEIIIGKLSPATLYTVRFIIVINGLHYSSEIESVAKNFTTGFERKDFFTTNFIWFIAFFGLICLLVVFYLLRFKIKWTRVESLISHRSIKVKSFLLNIYDDLQSCDFAHSVKVKEFEKYARRVAGSGELQLQFKMLPRGMMRPCEYGSLPINCPKNRDHNLIAYDETRVILGGNYPSYDSNYINANYIQGYCKERAYIATQSPKTNTIVDFWRMIWQEDVLVICMMEDVVEYGKIKCDQYWPEVEKTVEYGYITVLNIDQRKYAHYTYRTFQLSSRYTAGSRKIKHLQYTGWPQKGVPNYSHSIVEYLNQLRAIAPGPGPMVMHCTTGAGRTGTLILSDICLRSIAAEGTVDPFTEAKRMYNARANMLDDFQQYLLAHLVAIQCLILPSTKLFCSDISRQKITKMKQDLPDHMQRLAISDWKEEAMRPCRPVRFPTPDDIAKNRFPKLTPVVENLVSLKRYPPHNMHSNYISAVSVDGFKAKKEYIASQLPLPGTFSNFWRLVAEKKIELIIMLQRPEPKDPTCIDIIPCESTPLVPVPHLKVEHKTSSNCKEYFTKDQLLLTDSSGKEITTQYVTVLTCNEWDIADNAELPSPEIFVALWSMSEGISRAETPTLILCHDGVTGCGLYLALSYLLERMSVEQELDVILAVRTVRQSRPEFVTSTAQLEYLYDAAVKYLEGFETYANFA